MLERLEESKAEEKDSVGTVPEGDLGDPITGQELEDVFSVPGSYPGMWQ